MPTLAQRQRAAAAAAAATSKAALSSSSASTSTSAQLRQQQLVKDSSNTVPSSTTAPRQQSRQNNGAAEATSEESNYSDEDSDEDEAAAAFEMDSQELWTQNYCATCDCLIEPGQGVGIKKEKEEEAIVRPSAFSNTSRNSGLKSKTGTIKARPGSSDGNGNIKRTHSAGKLHATGTAGPLGPHKRTGSAAGRLNALSELRPTTKLNGDINKPKGNGGDAKRSPHLPRRDSGVSEQSAGANSTNSSGPSSPVSPNHSLAARTKKSRVTPTDEEVNQYNKVHSSPALYCSERCQQIDEQRSSGLGELVYYLHQPVSPTASNWSANGLNNSLGYHSWSSRNLAMANRAGSNAPGSPESECNCPECMDKNSASGTVPSGASDTTESSVGYAYGQGRRKQRTQSGRIMTPQGLLPPGGHANDYFGYVASNGQRRKSISKASQRGALDTISQISSTEASHLSSESAVSEMWEPVIKPTRQSTIRLPKTTQDSHTSGVSDETYGAATTGTVTPAATISSPRRAESPFAWHSSSSQMSSASPLRLLRQGDHHSHPSVDVTSDYAKSPQPSTSSFLSRSLAASENTELAASSGFTVGGISAMQQQQQGTSSMSSSSYILERRKETSESNRLTPFRMTNSPVPSEANSAIGTLKNAQSRDVSEALSQANRDDRRQSTSGSSLTSSTTSTWLRNSISSAWNTIRGLPASASTPENSERRESQFDHDTLGQMDLMTLTDHDIDPTPKQSQIARPRTTRGDIPAFANEIGHGGIPGEGNSNQRISYHSQDDDRLSKSLASAHETLDEERRRRKSEKERAQRHQRSKDVTVLPPLLGVSRTSSGINLPAHNKPTRPHHSQHSSSASLTGIHNRDRAGSYGQQNLQSGSFSQLNGLVPPTTPALRPGQVGGGGNGRMTPTIELGSSPGRMILAGSYSTSPRRGGLGWGAMTAIASPDAIQTTLVSTRPSSHTSHRHRHRHHQSSGSSTRQSHRSSGSSSNSGSSNNNLVVLGNVGHLGFHPHGSGPIYGIHATTPVRSSTPRVPEDGGEMSGAALKGEEQEQNDIHNHSQRRLSMAPPLRPRSGMMLHRQNDPHPPSMLKRNSTGLSPLAHQRSLSSAEEDMAPAVKMYPVLDIPNRQPTHDRYDTNWLLSGPEDSTAGAQKQQVEQQALSSTNRSQAQNNTNTNQDSTHRKRLFYFDTT